MTPELQEAIKRLNAAAERQTAQAHLLHSEAKALRAHIDECYRLLWEAITDVGTSSWRLEAGKLLNTHRPPT